MVIFEPKESAFNLPIRLNDSWDWSMQDHITTTELIPIPNSKTGKNDYKPVKNITRPILNLQHRTGDIELRDVQIYENDADNITFLFGLKNITMMFSSGDDLDTF